MSGEGESLKAPMFMTVKMIKMKILFMWAAIKSKGRMVYSYASGSLWLFLHVGTAVL